MYNNSEYKCSITMQSPILLCFAAVLACVCAQVNRLPTNDETRFFNFERNAGRGRIFGTLGSSDSGLFGRGGYKQDIFNDHRGRLQGQAYGSRVLGPAGDSSILGGKLNWNNNNARATLDVHKEIGRGSGVSLTGDGVWKLDKNTRLVTGGNFQKQFGHHTPELGAHAAIEHDF
ncbi:gloverin-like isoform X4 [Spodoptera litura]|uniref:Gloverin-like isoform X4 n=1 Tax=Spodoptera litura TaxID=69820 RepID=A0A9J7EWU2_SPOLT|nr:gloverin-like isoform X4 [Spodoptera litura]